VQYSKAIANVSSIIMRGLRPKLEAKARASAVDSSGVTCGVHDKKETLNEIAFGKVVELATEDTNLAQCVRRLPQVSCGIWLLVRILCDYLKEL